MRRALHAELDELISDVASLVRRVGQLMTDASAALWHADLRLAESIIHGQSEVIEARCQDVHHRCVRLLALQAPVATDLRIVVAIMRAVSDMVRMGKLAGHIAKIARMKHPVVHLPSDLEWVFARMTALATNLAEDAAQATEDREQRGVEQLSRVEHEMGTLHRQVFERLFAQDWSYGVEAAVDAALMGRYYTRFADHALAITRQVTFIVTGLPSRR